MLTVGGEPDHPSAGTRHAAGRGRVGRVPATADTPLDEAGSFTVTSGLLPEDEFPQFRSRASGSDTSAGPAGPFEPLEGDWYVGGLHADNSYVRLTRTVDLTGVPASDNPTLRLALLFDAEDCYDNVLLEARTAGAEAWTTLPELGGLSDTGVPAECEAGFLLDEHPFLEHYLSRVNPCTATGTSGEWHRMTGSSGGWQQVAFDLSAYAGEQVEVSVAYVTDPGTGGVGVFVDDTRVDVAGRPTLAEGFGLEQVADPAERSALLGQAVSGLIEGR